MYSYNIDSKPMFGLAISGGKQQVRELFSLAVHFRGKNIKFLRMRIPSRHRVLYSSRSRSVRATMMSKLSVSSLLLLLLFLVEVHSQQAFPYVSFGLTGPALADHSSVQWGVLVTIVTVLCVTLT